MFDTTGSPSPGSYSLAFSKKVPRWLHLTTLLVVSLSPLQPAGAISHGFLACGSRTYIVDADGETVWQYEGGTRDGYVLADGSVLLTLNKSDKYPGGAAIITTHKGPERLLWKGTQSEVNSIQPTAAGTFVLTEAGPNPRLLEIDKAGKIVVEFALACQTENHHMQTRMARKLSDGTFLAPHLLNFSVKQYDATGQVLKEFDTTAAGDQQHDIHTWPFTAIRHGKDHTLVCCTHGNRVVVFDGAGKVIWQLTNEDLPGPWLQDPCGAQVLPNGNYVITSYAAGAADPQAPKLIEVTPEKEVVWTYVDGKKQGIHHFQILDTDGESLEGIPLK